MPDRGAPGFAGHEQDLREAGGQAIEGAVRPEEPPLAARSADHLVEMRHAVAGDAEPDVVVEDGQFEHRRAVPRPTVAAHEGQF